jgi:hypothetical protein
MGCSDHHGAAPAEGAMRTAGMLRCGRCCYCHGYTTGVTPHALRQDGAVCSTVCFEYMRWLQRASAGCYTRHAAGRYGSSSAACCWYRAVRCCGVCTRAATLDCLVDLTCTVTDAYARVGALLLVRRRHVCYTVAGQTCLRYRCGGMTRLLQVGGRRVGSLPADIVPPILCCAGILMDDHVCERDVTALSRSVGTL